MIVCSPVQILADVSILFTDCIDIGVLTQTWLHQGISDLIDVSG